MNNDEAEVKAFFIIALILFAIVIATHKFSAEEIQLIHQTIQQQNLLWE